MREILPTYQVTIWMAGDLPTAKQVIREFCYETGACFTVTPTHFIYTGGEESGFQVGLVNYPRFPSTHEELKLKARELAMELLRACNQHSCLFVATDTTEWLSVKPPGAREAKA